MVPGASMGVTPVSRRAREMSVPLGALGLAHPLSRVRPSHGDPSSWSIRRIGDLRELDLPVLSSTEAPLPRRRAGSVMGVHGDGERRLTFGLTQPGRGHLAP